MGSADIGSVYAPAPMRSKGVPGFPATGAGTGPAKLARRGAMSSSDAARLTIDLDALAHNHAVLRRQVGGAEVAPVVKADGYGLGAERVARRLLAEGAQTLFVARVAEGVSLRRAIGAGPTIYVLDGCPPGSAMVLREAGLIPVLNSLAQMDEFGGTGGGKAALHVDTGMSRLGLRPREAAALAASPSRLVRIELTLLMSHLACAGDAANPMNLRQAKQFREVARLFPEVRASLSSSGGAYLGEAYRFDLVRPGISLYGGGPFGAPHPEIRAVATFEAPILQVRSVAADESIGYGATFTAGSQMTVAVLAAGYADGILRSSSPRGFAWFDGARRALLGRLSMDLIAVDVTGSDAAAPGALVELLGPNAPLDLAARAAGTAAYELLVRLGPRAERVYLESGASA